MDNNDEVDEDEDDLEGAVTRTALDDDDGIERPPLLLFLMPLLLLLAKILFNC